MHSKAADGERVASHAGIRHRLRGGDNWRANVENKSLKIG
jgi:hypothetical protein